MRITLGMCPGCKKVLAVDIDFQIVERLGKFEMKVSHFGLAAIDGEAPTHEPSDLAKACLENQQRNRRQRRLRSRAGDDEALLNQIETGGQAHDEYFGG